jgi:hypothetical protein
MDPKVRAHVAICMLSLLLERSLEARLREVGKRMTAPACFDLLAPIHLNMLTSGPDAEIVYDVTECPSEQRVILDGLQMARLVDPMMVAEQITPRSSD